MKKTWSVSTSIILMPSSITVHGTDVLTYLFHSSEEPFLSEFTASVRSAAARFGDVVSMDNLSEHETASQT